METLNKYRILYITNIPSPYRVNFFNQLSEHFDLTVMYEAEFMRTTTFNWLNKHNYRRVFLKKGHLRERGVNLNILRFLNNARRNHDLVIFTNYGYLTELLGITYMSLIRHPYIFEFDGISRKKRNAFVEIILKSIFKSSSSFLSPLEDTDIFLQERGVAKQKIYRYPFSSVSRSQVLSALPSVEHKNYLKNKRDIKYKKVVLTVGQFIHRKGFDVLIKSIKLGEFSPDTGFYLVGGKPTTEYLNLIEKNNIRNIHFVNFLNDEDLNEMYQLSDLFVLPTREDVWGLVINEAMARGLPVISTNKCGAALELISDGENGHLINVDDIEGLSLAIHDIIDNDDKRKRMAEKSLVTISRYTIESMVESHVLILNDILTNKVNSRIVKNGGKK